MHIEEIYKLARCSSVKTDTIEGFLLLGLLLSAPDAISEAALVELGAAKQHDTLYLLPPSPAGLGGFISVLESGVELHHACNAYRVQSMGQLRCLLLGVS